MTKQPEENWEKQIRKGVQVFDRKVYAIPYAGQMYEKLARELLLSERKRVVEGVKKLRDVEAEREQKAGEPKTANGNDLVWYGGKVQALDDVIRLIEGK